MSTDATCPIWGTPAVFFGVGPEGHRYESVRAGGRYAVPGQGLGHAFGRSPPWKKARLTTWIVEQHRAGENWPLVSIASAKAAFSRAPLTIGRKRDAALSFLADQSQLPGAIVRFGGLVDEAYTRNLYGLQVATEAIDPNEACSFLDFLCADRLLEMVEAGKYRITFSGWSQIEGDRSKQTASSQAFVAMWFDECMSDAYLLGIKAAVDETGFDPLRIDRKEHNNKIDDEIIAEIRRSRFVVADFTSLPGCPRGGVYFEAGFALGLNIPVIWSVRRDLIGDVHFDTRQYNHITWSNPVELKAKLVNRIGAVVGDGPRKQL